MPKVKLILKKKLRASVVDYVRKVTQGNNMSQKDTDRITLRVYSDLLTWLGRKSNSERAKLLLDANNCVVKFCEEGGS